MIKRALDASAAAIGLAVLSPVIAATALAVRVTLGRPVLFRQVRPGYRARPFILYKFRTMRDCFAAGGEPLPDNERLTPLGRFLRSTSLDELPALWNVLIGEMSLVGPRPLLMEYLPRYTPEQMRRHEVLPGITGWAQVNGRNALSWDRKFEMDTWYVENQSLWLDLRILIKTLGTVLCRRDISQEGQATVEYFSGTHADDGQR